MSQTNTLPISYNGSHCYNIEIRDSFEEFYNSLCELSLEKKRLCIVADSNVDAIYGAAFFQMLKAKGCPDVYRFTFPAGEENKTLSVIEDMYESLIQWQFDRSDVLIALGGGVTGDMTGYTAATYLRGIRFIQVPTSLLSMVDSSIGGKTGVDFRGYKNMVGAFHQPSLVYVNINVLKTLDKRQYASGMGEILKHGLIKNAPYFYWLKNSEKEIQLLEQDALLQMIFESQMIKKQVVEADPKEKGERAYLNFGHTIGHAIEKASDFTLLHGECVALGMISAAYISFLRGDLSKDDLILIEKVIASYGLPTRLKEIDNEKIIEICQHDKKKDGAVIKFILLKKLGQCYMTADVTGQEISNALDYIKEGFI